MRWLRVVAFLLLLGPVFACSTVSGSLDGSFHVQKDKPPEKAS